MSDDYLIWYKPNRRSRRQKIRKVVGTRRQLATEIIDLEVEGAVVTAVLRNGAMIDRAQVEARRR